jgi:hypothetical protein
VSSRASHYFFCIHLCSSLGRHKPPRQHAACALRDAAACSHVARLRYNPHQVCFTHRTHPTNKRQAAAGSLTRSTLAACRHEPLSESARRSPWLPPTAPVPPPRFACFVAGSIEALRHASISRRGSLGSPMRRLLLAWLRQRHQARRIGSLFVQAPSRGVALHVAAWSLCSPTSTPAAMAGRQQRQPRSSARFTCGAGFGGGALSLASAAVRAVRLLPAANACPPAHRLPPRQRLPFSAEVAAAPLAPLLPRSIPYDSICLKPRIDKGHNS